VILALAGQKPNCLCELRDCLSGVLPRGSLLCGSADNLAALQTEVRDALPVPITGVVSDQQHRNREAVRRVLADAAHQPVAGVNRQGATCHFSQVCVRDSSGTMRAAKRHLAIMYRSRQKMISPGIRLLVQRLFSDSTFQQTFLRSPDEALDGQVVSGEERRALLRLRTRLATANGAVEPRASDLAWWP
jgi:hypothetical protein